MASFISTSALGFGCEASSINLADRRAVLSVSTGPKTFFFSLWLFDLVLLALCDLAILKTARVAVKRRSKGLVKVTVVVLVKYYEVG